MKQNKLFLVLTALLLVVSALQFTSACRQNEYNDLSVDDGVIIVLRNVDYPNYDSHYWENEDRFPVYDYRYGYSYRATTAYKKELTERRSRSQHNLYYNNYNSYYPTRRNFQEEPTVYYTYDDYMRTYTEHECYVNPPKDKLIYVRCP